LAVSPGCCVSRPEASFTTALREQLGLKLESAKIERDTLIVEHLERPSET
jgi:uncharacterized protein (TIGR03435 family)